MSHKRKQTAPQKTKKTIQKNHKLRQKETKNSKPKLQKEKY